MRNSSSLVVHRCNISMTYWIAAAMGCPITSYSKAMAIAHCFTYDELKRIYARIKGGK